MRKTAALSWTILTLTTTLSAHAGDAVSSLNGKLGFNYGDYDSANGRTLTGSVAVPISTHYGAQFDGLYSRINSVDSYGAGGHLFWRDSSRGLIGLAAAGVDSVSTSTYEGGIEAEYYFRWLTPGIYTGYSTLRHQGSTPFIDTERTKPFGSVYLGMYPLPDLLIRPNFTCKLNNSYYGVEAEYTVRSSNFALTAEGTRGNHGFQQAQFGLRYYFGGKKSLKARHREDDPVNLIPGVVVASQTYQAEYTEKQNAYIEALIASSDLVISGNNTYTGVTTVSGGSLTLAGSGSVGGSSSVTSSSLVKNGSGSIVSFSSVTTSTIPASSILALTGTIISPTAGTLALNGTTITGGTLTGTMLNGGTLVINGALAGSTLTGGTLNGNTLTLAGSTLTLNTLSGSELILTGGTFTGDGVTFDFSAP